MEKTFLFSDVFVVILSLGRCLAARALRRSQYGIPEGKSAVALRIQDKDRDHAQTAATSERTASRQGSTVGYKGKLYYVYPTATKDLILVGNQTQYNAYKQALVAYGVTTSPDFVEETHGPPSRSCSAI